LDVEDAEPQRPVDIVTFASQCEKTYAKSVEDAYMTAFVFLYDFSVETAKSVSNK